MLINKKPCIDNVWLLEYMKDKVWNIYKALKKEKKSIKRFYIYMIILAIIFTNSIMVNRNNYKILYNICIGFRAFNNTCCIKKERLYKNRLYV